MPTPTTEQLRRINKFSQTLLEADQVYVFRSLSADTLPIKRSGFFGEYDLLLSEKMLSKLKKDYKAGAGLLASHDNQRLPFGRTYNAELTVDEVNGEYIKTLYIDHYVVTHIKDGEGNKLPLMTEINGMTTRDIVNHIEAGHTFDTSIGFSINEIKCSICGNDIRDYHKCDHIPGEKYTVNDEEVRCDLNVDSGEGIENSLVYAGAVNRAIIMHNESNNEAGESLSEVIQSSVNFDREGFYTVGEIKNVPLDAQVFCRLSKGNLNLFTATKERNCYSNAKKLKECEKMANETTVNTTADGLAVEAEETADFVSMAEYERIIGEKVSLTAQLDAANAELTMAKENLAAANGKVEELTVKANLAEVFTVDLIKATVKAGVATRGNAFNAERYEKYLRTLSVEEIKEELSAFKAEFPGTVEEARVTAKEVELSNKESAPAAMSKYELRQEAAKQAAAKYKKEGGDIAELTETIFINLLNEQKSE